MGRHSGWWLSQNFIFVFLILNLAALIQPGDASLAAMSIDLGSEFMKIGLVKPGVPMEIVLNKESRRKTPTIVAFRNSARFFGDVAAQMSVKFPANTITNSVDLVGKQFDNPIVAKYQRDFPHLKLSAHPELNTVVFNIDNKSFEIETIIAMLLWNAKEQTQAFADQPIKDVVISVPFYFNQAERVSVAAATKIAGLHLLSLMSNGAAAGLNYGVFRRKDINEKPQNLLVYDIGATKTTATLVEYHLEKKDPIMKVLSVGYDRTVGGRDVTEKLRAHLISEFKAKHKTKGNIEEDWRAMAKLWKEADRVKQVLSANTDHFAQVESLFEDKDFKVKVSRDLIEQFLRDLQPQFMQPLIDALKTIDFTPEQVETIVLMGAGTRIPYIQQIVKEYFGGRELARFLNTDEAIALGSVYEAAHLSKGFRVKPFEVNDLNLYPVQVRFMGLVNRTDVNGDTKQVEKEIVRELYPYLSRMPGPRKTIKFTSHHDDFKFYVYYGNLNHLTEKQLSELGQKDLMEVEVKGIAKALEKNGTHDDGNTYKFNGIKAVFKFSKYGTVKVDTAESTLEHVEKSENSTLSNIVNTIGSIFSSGTKEKGKNEEEASEDESTNSSQESTKTLPDDAVNTNQTDTAGDDKINTSDATNATDSERANKVNDLKNDTKPSVIKPPPKFIRTKLTIDIKQQYAFLSPKQITEFSKILTDFERSERQKRELEAASNALESLVYDMAVKLEEEEWLKHEEYVAEVQAVQSEVDELKTWIEDEAAQADVKTLRKRYEKLSGLFRAVVMKDQKRKEKILKEQHARQKVVRLAMRQEFLKLVYQTPETTNFTPIFGKDQHGGEL